MACNCKKKPATEADPMVFGEPNGIVFEVIASVKLLGLKPNERTWVTGTHVQTMIDSGWIKRA